LGKVACKMSLSGVCGEAFSSAPLFLRQVQRTTHILMNDAAGDTLIHLNKRTARSSLSQRERTAGGGATRARRQFRLGFPLMSPLISLSQRDPHLLKHCDASTLRRSRRCDRARMESGLSSCFKFVPLM
jgi:hypothetical protein